MKRPEIVWGEKYSPMNMFRVSSSMCGWTWGQAIGSHDIESYSQLFRLAHDFGGKMVKIIMRRPGMRTRCRVIEVRRMSTVLYSVPISPQCTALWPTTTQPQATRINGPKVGWGTDIDRIHRFLIVETFSEIPWRSYTSLALRFCRFRWT